MLNSVEDVRKEFNNSILILGNKFFMIFMLINYVLSGFNIYYTYIYKKELTSVYLVILLIDTCSLILTLIINIINKWKSKLPAYISMVVVNVLVCIAVCLYRDTDNLLFLVCCIPVTMVFLDTYFTCLMGGLVEISIVFMMLYNMYHVAGRNLVYSIWLYYVPMALTLMFTIFFAIFCNKIRSIMLNERIDEYEIEKNKKENDFANKIQEGFLNHEFPSNDIYEISACMLPCKNVGGDFYDYYVLDKSRIAMLVADVSGKGVPAALFMANAKTVIKDYVTYGVSFEKTLETANRDIMDENKEMQFITMFICIIDLLTGKMNYINAGHVKPFVIDKDGKVSIIDSKPDFVFGVRKDTRYHSNEYKLNLGDKLFLCTDGVTERLDVNNKLFGKERLMEVLKTNSKKETKDIISSVISSLEEFSKGRERNDDITCLAFNYKKELVLEPAIEKDFDIAKDKVTDIVTYIKEVLKSKNVPAKIISLVAVASDEIISNVSKYAYEGMNVKNSININIQVYNRVIDIVYTDYGKYFNPLSKITLSGTTKVTDKSKIGGLGIQLTWNIMDRVSYNRIDDKNKIFIEKEF